MTDQKHSLPGEFGRNWTLLLPCLGGIFLLTLHTYSLGVMVKPLENEFGWSRAEIFSGNLIVAVIALIVSPIIGRTIDRIGPRSVAIAGVITYSLVFAFVSTATASIWSWWLRWVLLGLGSAIIMPTVWATAINGVFDRHRGKALAIAMLGSGLCAAVLPWFTTLLFTKFGWRAAYLLLPAIVGGIVLILVLAFFRSESARQPDINSAADPLPVVGYSARQGLRSPEFFKMAVAIFLFGVTSLAFAVNAVPVLESYGFNGIAAASIAGLLGLGSIAGRVMGGVLLDSFDARKVAALAVLAPLISIMMLMIVPGNAIVASVAMAVLGLSLGTEVDACAYLSARHFGMRAFGVLYGTINGLAFFGGGMAPVLASFVFDATGSYDIVLWATVPMCLIPAALFLSLGASPGFASTTREAETI